MKVLAWIAGAVTLAATGAYVFIYLARWEWHRALLVAVFFVAAELGMLGALLLRRLTRLEASAAAEADTAVLDRLRSAPYPDRFAWLERSVGRTNVFLTILLGGGVIVSAGAWLLDRLAGRTAGPGTDRAIASRLRPLSLPDGFVADDAELLARDRPYADDPGLRLLVGPSPDHR